MCTDSSELSQSWIQEELFVKRSHNSALTRRKSARSEENSTHSKQQRTSATAHSRATSAPPTRESRPDESSIFRERKRLFLGVGDEVTHVRYEQWGIGVVMECMTSSVPGGTCLVRIRFQDGQLRCFNNDLDNDTCCYYFGMRRYWNPTHGVNAIRSKFFLRG